MGLKLLHTADLHLDSPFREFDRQRREELRRESLALPGRIAELCRREGCDVLLLAGDIFDGRPTRESLDALKNALEEAGVPAFLTPGNHDYGGFWQSERWPGNLHIFAGDWESVSLPDLDCRVWGAGYEQMDCPGLLEGFRAWGEEKHQIGLVHGDAVNPGSPYCPVTPAQARQSGLQYLALGHVHRAGSFRAGDTLCGWPGCPMGRGWDETGQKGVYIVDVGERTELRFLPIPGIRFFDLEIPAGELENRLPGGETRDFYRITLTGEGEGEICLPGIPNLWLRDLRTAPGDIWELAGEDTLEGVYFCMLRQQAQAGEEAAALAARISRELLLGREVALP